MSSLAYPLFDKFIDIELVDNNSLSTEINTPSTGIKPDMALTGKYVGTGNSVMPQLSLRITNFYPDVPLSQYKNVIIKAGYRNSLFDTLVGQIQWAFQESPSPDGVTNFVFLPGNFNKYVNTILPNRHWEPYTSIGLVLVDISIACGLEQPIINFLDDHRIGPNGLDWNMSAKDLLQTLRNAYQFDYRITGNTLVAWDSDRSSGITHFINYLSSSPQVSAAGVTFVAPWVPALKPGDLIQIDPAFSRQNYGGSLNSLSPFQKVISVDFNFSTVRETNTMTVLAVNVDVQS